VGQTRSHCAIQSSGEVKIFIRSPLLQDRMVKYRQFSPRDLFSVIRFVNTVFRTEYSPSVFMNMYNMWNGGFLVAKEHGRIVGVVSAIFISSRSVRMLLLGVSETHRHRGIGTALLQKLMLNASSRGASLITLEVRENNHAAIDFYERFGFTISYIIPRFYKNHESAYVMNRLLHS